MPLRKEVRGRLLLPNDQGDTQNDNDGQQPADQVLAVLELERPKHGISPEPFPHRSMIEAGMALHDLV